MSSIEHVIPFLKGHDCVIISQTNGSVSQPWKARSRESGLAGYGNTPELAALRLVENYQTEASEIHKEVLAYFGSSNSEPVASPDEYGPENLYDATMQHDFKNDNAEGD